MTDDESENREKNVKLFVRILPLEKPCESCAKVDFYHKTIYIRCLRDLHRIKPAKEPSYWCFKTDGIFHHASQDEVYSITSKDFVTKALDGIDCTLIGYGQTGSGKSFTIGGYKNKWEHRGLVTRLLSDLFAEKTNRKRVNKIKYRLSIVEFHGKRIADLLIFGKENIVRIGNDTFKDVTVVDLRNEEEGLRKIFEAETRRTFERNSVCPDSHLGTIVITFHVYNSNSVASWAVLAKAKIHIVEMAGTGSIRKNLCSKSLFDTNMANLMKMEIEQFFSNLRYVKNSSSSIIYTNNLLRYLRHSLGFTSIIRFIAHVRITEEDLDDTLSTLRFGAKISKLNPTKLVLHIESQTESIIRKLQEEVDSLRKELDINAMIFNQEASTNISKSRAEQINRDILNYLNGDISDMTLFDVCQAQTLLKIVKEIYNKLTAEQLEVNKLRESYERALKSTMDKDSSGNSSQAKDAKVNGASTATGKKRSKSVELEGSQSVSEERKQRDDQVGILSNTGVTVGPAKDEAMFETKKSKVPRYVKPYEEDEVVESELFNDDAEYISLKKKFDRIQEALDRARAKFTSLIENYSEIKAQLESSRNELVKHRRNQRCSDAEVYTDKVGRSLLPETETEKKLLREIARTEDTLAKIEMEVSWLHDEIRMLMDRRSAIQFKLKAVIRKYRDIHDTKLDDEKKSEEKQETEETTFKGIPFAPVKSSLEKIQYVFEELQRTLTRMKEGRRKVTETWEVCAPQKHK